MEAKKFIASKETSLVVLSIWGTVMVLGIILNIVLHKISLALWQFIALFFGVIGYLQGDLIRKYQNLVTHILDHIEPIPPRPSQTESVKQKVKVNVSSTTKSE